MKVIPNPKYKEALMMAKCPLCNKTMLLGGVILENSMTSQGRYFRRCSERVKICLSCSNKIDLLAGCMNEYDRAHPQEFQRKEADAISYVKDLLPSCQNEKLKDCLTAMLDARHIERRQIAKAKENTATAGKKTELFLRQAKKRYNDLQGKIGSFPKRQSDGNLLIAFSDTKMLYSTLAAYKGILEYNAGKLSTDEIYREKVERASKEFIQISPDRLLRIIPKEDILYFQEKGSVQYSSNVTGKIESDYDASSAAKGALLFGTAGAIVGAMAGSSTTGEIKTETIEHDSRYISMMLKSASGKNEELTMPFSLASFLMKHIPEKEYSYYMGQKVSAPASHTEGSTKANPIPVANVAASPFEEIKHFKELLDMGIITQEEFDIKKKQLLGL